MTLTSSNIGTIAELSLQQLHQRLAETRFTDRGLPASRPLRLAIVGATLPQRLRADLESEQGEAIEPVGTYRRREDLLKAEPAPDVDVLLVELPMLDGASVSDIRELTRHCGASRTLVVFGFGASEVVAQLERSGVVTLRFPVTWEEIRVLAGAQAPRPTPKETTDLDAGLMEKPPDRLYDDRQLARAAVTSTAVKCECPQLKPAARTDSG